MACEVSSVTLPSYWASALVNGDYSGFDDDAEMQRCQDAEAALAKDGWSVCGVDDDEDTGEMQEPRFTWSYYLYDVGCDPKIRGGEVLDYTIIRSVR